MLRAMQIRSLFLAPVLLGAQTPLHPSYVVERIVLPEGFNNAWVIIEYSASGAFFGKEAEYQVGRSGYLQVPDSAPREFSKLLVRIGNGPFFDATKSPRILRAGRTSLNRVSASGERSNRDFLVFFVGKEGAIQDSWSHHLPDRRTP